MDMASFSVAAGALLLISWALLVLFFVKKNETADLLSNWVALAAVISIGVTMGAVLRRFAGEAPVLVSLVTAVGLLAVTVNLVLEAALVLGRVEFPRIAVPVTATWAVLFVWIAAASGFVLAYGEPAGLGWLGLATIAYTMGVLVLVMRDPAVRRGTATPAGWEMAVAAPVLLLVPAWFVCLGLAL